MKIGTYMKTIFSVRYKTAYRRRTTENLYQPTHTHTNTQNVCIMALDLFEMYLFSSDYFDSVQLSQINKSPKGFGPGLFLEGVFPGCLTPLLCQ